MRQLPSGSHLEMFAILQYNLPAHAVTSLLDLHFADNSYRIAPPVYFQSLPSDFQAFWYPDCKRSWNIEKKALVLWVKDWSGSKIMFMLSLVLFIDLLKFIQMHLSSSMQVSKTNRYVPTIFILLFWFSRRLSVIGSEIYLACWWSIYVAFKNRIDIRLVVLLLIY